MPSKTTDKYIFLDRDGTLIKDSGYVYKARDLKFLPGTISGLKKLKKLGYKFIIISNQAGIARGFYSSKDAEKFNSELISKLANHGIKIEKIYICPHHPDITGICSCRKPAIGLALKASRKFNINLRNSYFIGDKDCDIELGKNCGGKTILINNGQYKIRAKSNYTAKNILEVVNVLKSQS